MTKGAGHNGSRGEDKTAAAGETKPHGDLVREDPETAGETKPHGNPVREDSDTAGETNPHSDLMQEDFENAESMTDALKRLFPQVDNPQPNGTQPRRRRLVEENLQTPGQPALPYVPLDESFRAAGEKSFLFGAFIQAWDKMMAGEV
ncbi:uncharacterized protein BDR25DRAFT_339940 [Lindgomyces ingoldianus]|uniref:Uncharacterized protein n=1 Tax=Lindgomyces ingoldianus TaxID=673940 RepID=A0ACB6RAB7_9PLEO|nr:uncharacterized protein BDR25DRAFT_339940 [Lindgomyces ingoldianus]KAF2476081.1 hypothetical protein BDR25DRAFT_339940 [Lindgomyces ingoldianus]